MPVQVPQGLYAELKRELSCLPKRTRRGDHGESARDQVFRRYRARGLTPSLYYKLLRAECGSQRSDCGRSRKPDGWAGKIRHVFDVQCQLSDIDQGRFMASEVAVAHAERMGILHPGELSVRNYNLWVKKLGLREARGIVRIQAAYSNQVHQVDVTGSAYLAVVQDLGGGEFLLRRRNPRERLAKKQSEERLRLWAIAVTDDFSGLAVSQYVVAPGESALLVQDFLLDAWRGMDAALPLRGLPELLYCDNGPFAKSETTLAFLSRETGVGVDLKTHMPYRARSTGKVERRHAHFKNRFEMQFLAGKSEWLLSEVNKMLVEWAVQCADLRHRYADNAAGSTYRMTRGDAYLAYLSNVKLPHQEASRNAYRVLTRTAGLDGLLRVNNMIYHVGDELRNRKLLVQINVLGEVRVTDPLTNVTVEPVVWSGPRVYGDFESRPETAMDQTAKQREAGEWGNLPHEMSEPVSGKVVPFVSATEQETPNTVFTVNAEFGSVIEAKQWLARELNIGLMNFRRDYPGLWAEFEDLVSRTLNREEVAHWARRDALRVAIGGGR